jgi:plasmid stabilization system protein ParE
MEGLDAAEAGYTLAVSQMFNPLRRVASPKNPRSPAFAEPAALNFAKVIARISETSPLQAEQVFTAVGDMLEKLQEFPDLGVKGKYPDTRELAFYGYPITLVFTLDEDAAVTVVAVFYTSETLS